MPRYVHMLKICLKGICSPFGRKTFPTLGERKGEMLLLFFAGLNTPFD